MKQQARKNLKITTKVRIELSKYSFLEEIFSVPPQILFRWTRKYLGIPTPGFDTDKDLEEGHYEGGGKVWEATADLAKFITEDQQFIGKLLQDNSKCIRILELGCGSGLVSLAFISRLIHDESFKSDYAIHVQDYNWEVLASTTLLNFAFNLPLNFVNTLIATKTLRFFYGDWSQFRKNKNSRYNLIMMSETTYNAENYHALHDLLNNRLKNHGYVVMATKDTYFGLSGGLYSWLAFLEERGVFIPVKMLKVFQTNIPRSILVLRKIPLTSVEVTIPTDDK